MADFPQYAPTSRYGPGATRAASWSATPSSGGMNPRAASASRCARGSTLLTYGGHERSGGPSGPATQSPGAVGMASVTKRVLLGRPLATHAEHEQRMRKLIALPIFAADAIASSAFATQEILHVLVPV